MESKSFSDRILTGIFSVTVGWVVLKVLNVIFNRLSRQTRKNALRGKVVVITGASSGIGEALAHTFYELGCQVVLAARREAELMRVKHDLLSKKLNTSPEDPLVLPLDVGDMKQIDTFVDKVHSSRGPVDILINNAGIYSVGTALGMKMEVHEKLMFVNYLGAVALTKAVLPKMVQRKSGHIVFMSSVNGLISTPNNSAYAATKHAMQAFADSLRAELHTSKVNVTVISPGYVHTPITLTALTESGDHYGVMTPEIASGLTPEYIAERTLNGILDGAKELVVAQFEAHLGVFLRHWLPSAYFSYMAIAANRKP